MAQLERRQQEEQLREQGFDESTIASILKAEDSKPTQKTIGKSVLFMIVAAVGVLLLIIITVVLLSPTETDSSNAPFISEEALSKYRVPWKFYADEYPMKEVYYQNGEKQSVKRYEIESKKDPQVTTVVKSEGKITDRSTYYLDKNNNILRFKNETVNLIYHYQNGKPINRMSEDGKFHYQYGYDNKGRLIEVIEKEGEGAGELYFYREDDYLPYALTFIYDSNYTRDEALEEAYLISYDDKNRKIKLEMTVEIDAAQYTSVFEYVYE